MSAERNVLIALRRGGRPMTSAEIAAELGAIRATIHNAVCRLMKWGMLDGVLTGRRSERRYVPRAAMLDRDRELLRLLVQAYGAAAVRRAVTEEAAP
jgi:predicted transcriptional regulator